jgi:opacity protein-like surface antigen
MKLLGFVALLGAAGISGTAQAGGVYAGADLVQLDSELDFTLLGSPKEKYTTNHLRLKGGIEATNWLSVEAQLLTGADDTAVDIFGDTYSYDTGMIFGIFAKPHVTIGSVDLYGLLGYATADAEYDCVPSCPPGAKASLDGVAYGFGAQFLATKNLKISLDYMSYYDGEENFIDVTTSGFGVGANYKF